GTVDSGLNSMVLASNSELVLLPVNEPTYGTRRRSQIESYLIANRGEGVQHMALKTDDIFATVSAMRGATHSGGFSFMDPPSKEYYAELPSRIGDALQAWQLEKAQVPACTFGKGNFKELFKSVEQFERSLEAS
ncbi:MAG: hypothetical protein SGPRY_013830, partial [Prymnesium sp.]